jgi:hypothetical protein
MLDRLLLLSFAAFGCPHIINPRQNMNLSSAAPVTSTGNRLEWAKACISSKRSWAMDHGTRLASSTVLLTSETYSGINNAVEYETTTSLNKNATPYTLCDKWPRLDGSTSIIEHSYQQTDPWTTTFVTTMSFFTSYPAPNCTILKPDCDILYASYSSAEKSYIAAQSSYESSVSSASSAGITTTFDPPTYDYNSPICGSPTPFGSTVGSFSCAFASATVQLLYWPVARQTTDLCNSNASLATLGPTMPGKPNTAVYDGTTLTSPTVYIALEAHGRWNRQARS